MIRNELLLRQKSAESRHGGHGDYVKDRQDWQKNYSVDALVEAINKKYNE